jgi:pimeloyl-ACP methyl ester carboxylesterase
MDTEEVSFASRDVRLNGTIALPAAAGRHPGLVLIGGSGPSDRHNDGFFDALCEHLVASGIATLTYDKRGVCASTGDWRTATVDDLAADAGAAVATLRRHARATPGAVGVMGHSEGGWVALRLYATARLTAPLVLNSCPAVPFVDSEVHALTAAGVPTDDASRAGVLLRELAAAASAGLALDHGRRLIAGAQQERWYAAAQASGFVLDATSWAQLKVWGEYDPADDLSVVAAPTLVVLGANDPLTPVDASASRYEVTARVARRRQEIAVFRGADHRLLSPTTGAFAAGYIERLTRWSLDERHIAETRPDADR